MSGFIFIAEISIFGGFLVLAMFFFIGWLVDKRKIKEPPDNTPDIGRNGPDRPADNELDDGPGD